MEKNVYKCQKYLRNGLIFLTAFLELVTLEHTAWNRFYQETMRTVLS